MKINKIMLGVPNKRWNKTIQWNDFPYTFGVLNSVLKDNYDVKILDAGFYDLSEEDIKNQIADYKPDIFGVSCLSFYNDKDFKKLTGLVKESYPETTIIGGGIYPTLLPEKFMRNKDIKYAIMGEGEYRLPKLLRYLEKEKNIENLDGLVYRSDDKLVINPIKSYIKDLDSLPFPNYDCLEFYDYANNFSKRSPTIMPRNFPYAQVITSRGCPFDCIFCSSTAINGKGIRFRSADKVLEEIDLLVEKYGVKEIVFMDDNFFIDKKRAKKVFNGLIKRNYDLEWKAADGQIIALDDEMLELMKESKCYQLNISVETASEEQLRMMNKPVKTYSMTKQVIDKTKSLGMSVLSPFIIGFPDETWEQIRNVGTYAEELDLDYVTFNIATILPGTKLYEIAKKRNLLPENFDFNKFKNFGYPIIKSKSFTPEELLMFRVMEWDRINFKTLKKREKIAELSGITLEELDEWRKDTRRSLKVKYKD